MNCNKKKWLLALALSLPIILFYGVHFFYHDANHKPSGLIQWENALYMHSAKEYKTGNAVIFYQYPLDDDPQSPKIFFQPQQFILGYLWKYFPLEPGIIISIFGLIFTLFTIRVSIEIISNTLPEKKHLVLTSFLFTWGGGILSLCGIVLHFVYFKNTGNLSDHIFFLDPGNGWWCLNFGRALVYPLEAYYHFLFMLIILSAMQKKFVRVALLIIVLTLSHPYSSTEILLIIASWAFIEFFYLKSKEIKMKDLALISAALIFHLLYYCVLLQQYPVSAVISQQVALNWSYKAWHFIPAYFIVWVLGFWAVKNVALLQKHFSSPINRLFFCFGFFAFLLSIHGFAIKPIQPLHYTRGYVYAGFFLFAIPVIIGILNYVQEKKSTLFKVATFTFILIFLSDNISWFYLNSSKNGTGVLFTKNQQELIHFFSKKNEKGWIISTEKNEKTTSFLQLYSLYKGWIPHPILTFNIASKKEAVNIFLFQQKVDDRWTKVPAYFYAEKNDTALNNKKIIFPVVFENEEYKVYKIN